MKEIDRMKRLSGINEASRPANDPLIEDAVQNYLDEMIKELTKVSKKLRPKYYELTSKHDRKQVDKLLEDEAKYYPEAYLHILKGLFN